MCCPSDLVRPVMVPMYCTRENQEYDREVDPAECIFPRLRPRIFSARCDQPRWTAARYLDIDSFRQVLERHCGCALGDEGPQGRHGRVQDVPTLEMAKTWAVSLRSWDCYHSNLGFRKGWMRKRYWRIERWVQAWAKGRLYGAGVYISAPFAR